MQVITIELPPTLSFSSLPFPFHLSPLLTFILEQTSLVEAAQWLYTCEAILHHISTLRGNAIEEDSINGTRCTVISQLEHRSIALGS
jgi:hypothetical protein